MFIHNTAPGKWTEMRVLHEENQQFVGLRGRPDYTLESNTNKSRSDSRTGKWLLPFLMLLMTFSPLNFKLSVSKKTPGCLTSVHKNKREIADFGNLTFLRKITQNYQ